MYTFLCKVWSYIAGWYYLWEFLVILFADILAGIFLFSRYEKRFEEERKAENIRKEEFENAKNRVRAVSYLAPKIQEIIQLVHIWHAQTVEAPETVHLGLPGRPIFLQKIEALLARRDLWNFHDPWGLHAGLLSIQEITQEAYSSKNLNEFKENAAIAKIHINMVSEGLGRSSLISSNKP